MTKAQIKAELRRSAMEDECPLFFVSVEAFDEAVKYKDAFERQYVWSLSPDQQRYFFLLVAEAL